MRDDSMNTTALAHTSNNRDVLLPDTGGKDVQSRINQFCDWLNAHQCHWSNPDLAAYRDHLRDVRGLAGSSISAHLATIRSRYNALLRDNDVRDYIMSAATQYLPAGSTPADIIATGSEALQRLTNSVDPKNSPVKVVKKQDHTDAEHLRLTSAQANTLMSKPGVDTLKGLRDTAILAMMLCTGAREQEIVNLHVDDLRQRLDGKLALHIRNGKGAKSRLVPYGALEWCLVIVDKWLTTADISEGLVFRSLDRHENIGDSLSVRAVQKMLESYPIAIDGKLTHVKPHDARRTYARRQYDAGLSVEAIQQNLGHKSRQTTIDYIGQLDAEQREAKNVYDFDLSILNGAASERTA
jgi:site-specific recombinase XerD